MSKNGIPDEWVTERVQKAEVSLLFGVPFSELDREELLACAVEGWESYLKKVEDHQRERKFLNEIHEARYGKTQN